MTKIKALTVLWGFPDPNHQGVFNYRVERVIDSVEFHPQQILTKDQIKELCASREWKVTIVGGARK